MATVLEARANLTSQNQITIPAPVRKALNLRGGKSAVSFAIQSNGTVQFSRIQSTTSQKKDTALGPFLELLADDMKRHPERIKPFPAALFKKAQQLVRNVKIDLDAPLAED